MSLIRGFFYFWYDFLIGDAWDIALGVVVVLAAIGLIARVQPATDELLGPVLAAAVILLMWVSLRREIRHH